MIGSIRGPLVWVREGIEILEGPGMVQMTVDKINIIKNRLKAAQDRQKSCADQHHREMKY